MNREEKGFTVIELLITLAIVGILAISLVPKLLFTPGSAPEKPVKPSVVDENSAKQKRTVADLRNTGTALFSWLTDQVGAAAAGEASTTVDLRDYHSIDHADLVTILVPQYLHEVPDLDGWENRYEYALNVANPLGPQVMAIRSPGRDGLADADVYTVTSFDPSDYDQDILWADGFFVRWPQRR
ncbi:MAG TPA: prepilin-type N-terminal cleavage/methylation domain-containing protein [Thermoanaerobaculia bacterium]|nr:prepilin-type N-terminal cleavage/methylation domain-containing protein [Thermoanaerobaculia bacterium]